MASGLRLTYMCKLDMHSLSLKVRDIQVWQPSVAPALVQSDNNFGKSVMICQIIDSVDNHFGEYLWHFLAVRLYSWHNSKEPADCKLIHETVQHNSKEPADCKLMQKLQQLHAELIQTRDAIRWHQAPKPELFYCDTIKTKLVSFTYIGHFSCLSSMGYRVLWNWFHVKWG